MKKWRKQMLIGLNGRLKSGKDTTFNVIKELEPTAERVSFAAKLKESAAASIGLDVDTLEMLKGKEDLFFIAGGVFKFNVRQYLQWFGTEGHREVFGDNFWVDQALPRDLVHDARLIVVTDMRFPNEAQRVIDLGGLTVKVEREVETAHSAHASEQNIDEMIDYFLDNTGTLDDLRESVKGLISHLRRHPTRRNPGFSFRPFPTDSGKPVVVKR
jgi:hypothetical protein